MSINSELSNFLTNPLIYPIFYQVGAVQALAGAASASYASYKLINSECIKDFFSRKPSSINLKIQPGRVLKSVRGLFYLTVAATGITLLMKGAHGLNHSIALLNDMNCELSANRQQLHPREKEVASIFGCNALSTSADDLRDKLIFVEALDDANGAANMNPAKFSHLSELSKTYDIAFRVINTRDDICNEIDKAANNGEVSGLWMTMHSSSHSGSMSTEKKGAGVIIGGTGIISNGIRGFSGALSSLAGFISKDVEDALNLNFRNNCFQRLSRKAKIIFEGCSAGESDDGIAAYIAQTAQRVVTAPDTPVAYATTEIVDSANLYVKMFSIDGRRSDRRFSPTGEVTTPDNKGVKLDFTINLIEILFKNLLPIPFLMTLCFLYGIQYSEKVGKFLEDYLIKLKMFQKASDKDSEIDKALDQVKLAIDSFSKNKDCGESNLGLIRSLLNLAILLKQKGRLKDSDWASTHALARFNSAVDEKILEKIKGLEFPKDEDEEVFKAMLLVKLAKDLFSQNKRSGESNLLLVRTLLNFEKVMKQKGRFIEAAWAKTHAMARYNSARDENLFRNNQAIKFDY